MLVYIGRYPKNPSKDRKVRVRIDKYDTWSMDHTLAFIILPMLKQLRDTKHGVPNEFATFGGESWDPQKSFDFYDQDNNPEETSKLFNQKSTGWDDTLNKMIFAFEHIIDDSWEDDFRSGEMDKEFIPCAWDKKGKPTLYEWIDGPNHTYECDYDGIAKVWEQIQEGLNLFGKYYRNLWD